MEVRICAIAAMAENRVIGRGHQIPWKLSEDMRRFAALTTGHSVLMGRRTFESLPPRFRPLPDRVNLVATRSPGGLAEWGDRVQVCASAEALLHALRSGDQTVPSGVVWIAGGEQIYLATRPYWDEVYLTLVKGTPAGDAFFPEFEGEFELTEREPHEGFAFCRYIRKAGQ